MVLLPLFSLAWSESSKAAGNVEARLISEQTTVTPNRPFYVGLRMKIRRGWHTYWKNPGDAGLPPRITWKLPEGFTADPIEWPVPERFLENTLMTYGYEREVLFPVRIHPPKRIGPELVTLAGKLDWLECKDVCLPGSAELRLSLPVSPVPATPGPDAPAFDAARSRLPGEPTGWSFSAEAGPRAIALSVKPPSRISARGAYLFVDQPLLVEHAAPQGFERTEAGYRLTAMPAANASGNPGRLSGVLVIEEGGASKARTAFHIDVPVIPGDPAPAPPPSPRSDFPGLAYAGALGIAGLGLVFLLLHARRKSTRTKPLGDRS